MEKHFRILPPCDFSLLYHHLRHATHPGSHTKTPFPATLFWEWRRVAPAVGSSFPNSSDSRSCTDCLTSRLRIARSTVHPPRPATIGFDRPVRLVPQTLIDIERLACRMHRGHPVSRCFGFSTV